MAWKKDEVRSQSTESFAPSAASVPAALAVPSASPSASAPIPVSPRAAACISQGIRIKGEVTGSEDLFVDGVVDGRLNLTNGSLTIGPNGTVKADVNAREVIVRGNVEGRVSGRDKVQLWSTGRVNGEVQTERLAIEEGAVLRGKVEAGKLSTKPAESKAVAASASSGKSADATSVSSGTAAN